MINDSPELKAVVSRWLNALQTKDGNALTNLLSESEHLRYIGTDVNEFWSGMVVRQGYATHIEEIPEFNLTPTVLEAFECGNTGWASCVAELRVAGMKECYVERFSWVFVLEAGAWKIAQAHSSFPRTNLDTIGVEHLALDELIESARKDFDQYESEGTTTVMFTDIANSTAIASAVGDRVWASTINWHIESLSGVIEESGGNVVKTLGDGTMSTFASARGAMTAARIIQRRVNCSQREPGFKIRIGIHTGDVVQAKGDFFGNVVNKAARIASAADPAQILVSDATRVMVDSSGDFRFGDPVHVILRGITGDQIISVLEWS